MRRELLNKLYLEAIGGGRTGASAMGCTEFCVDGDYATESTVKEREVNSKSNAIIILTGYAVIIKQGFFAELSNGLEAVPIEKVVKEDGMVSGQVEVADFPHFVQGW